MSRFLFLAILFLTVLPVHPSRADTRRGTTELSLSPAFESVKYSSDTDNPSAQTVIMLPVRLGVFVTRDLEIEGDMNLTSTDNSTGLWAFFNVAYNFRANEGKVRPFILAGVGLGNAARVLGLAVETDNSVLGYDLGAGLKTLLTEHVGFRVEYRYDRVTYDSDDYTWWTGVTSEEVTFQGHRLLMGLTVFFGTD